MKLSLRHDNQLPQHMHVAYNQSSKLFCKQLPAWFFGDCVLQFCQSPN